MGVGAGLYMCDVVKRSSRSLSHLLMSSCFVCLWNISGTAERICAKFTWKTCLVRRSEEFEGQGQRSKVKITRNKNGISALSAAGVVFTFGKSSLASSLS